MAKRYAHRLKGFGMGQMPTTILCVQGAVRQEYHSDADACGTQELDSWAACRMDLLGSTYRTGATQHGSTPADVWQWVKQNTSFGSSIWLVSIDAREQAAILGLWDRIMDRTATVCGADPWSRIAGDDDGGSKGGKGFVVLESPPTVIQFSLEDTPGKFTWVDPANYGTGNLHSAACAAAKVSREPARVPQSAWLDPMTLPYQVEVVNDWVSAYVDTLISLGIGAIEHTAASQAMSGYRRRYMRDAIYVHDNLATLKLERAGLYGGRCECSFVGTVYGDGMPSPELVDQQTPSGWTATDGLIYHLDVNSLYPSVARDAMLPIKLITSTRNVTVDTLRRAVDKIACVARVYVETDLPIVPLRHDDSLLFPVGKFWTTICGPELRLAMQRGSITRVAAFAGYESAAIYRQWVDDLYEARCKAASRGNTAMADAIKSLLNSSFGKWAQRSRRWVSKPDELCMLPFSQWWQVDDKTQTAEQWRSFAWAVERCEIAGEPSESIPILTATIHSLGRVRLWNLMETAGRNNLYYVDTDSLWVNERGYKALVADGEIDATALGKLKVVRKHRHVTWWGQKRYAADGRLTVAGAPLGSLQTGDAWADTLRAYPIQSYLYQDQAPGTDRHLARVRLNLPYLVGDVLPTGEVEPKKVVDRPEDV